MSACISQRDLDEVDRRIAPIKAKRLGQALYQQRNKAGVGAAALPGIDERALDDFESGRRRPDGATVITIMDICGCSLDELVPLHFPLVPTDMSGWSDTQVLEHYLAAVQ